MDVWGLSFFPNEGVQSYTPLDLLVGCFGEVESKWTDEGRAWTVSLRTKGTVDPGAGLLGPTDREDLRSPSLEKDHLVNMCFRKLKGQDVAMILLCQTVAWEASQSQSRRSKELHHEQGERSEESVEVAGVAQMESPPMWRGNRETSNRWVFLAFAV